MVAVPVFHLVGRVEYIKRTVIVRDHQHRRAAKLRQSGIDSSRLRIRPGGYSLHSIPFPVRYDRVKTFWRSIFSGLSARKAAQSLPALLLVLLVAGCPAKKPEVGTLQGKVVIKGSNTFGEELARGIIEEYRKEQPNVVFDLESEGTASGFAALLAGQCDLAAASRAANKDELEAARTRGIELNDQVIGYYGVAVIVNPRNSVAKLKSAQVRDIFTGGIQNWKAVGGLDAPIHLYIRDAVSGTHLGFRELAMENKPYAAGAQTFTNYAQLAAAVAQDPNGIGYSSMSLADRAGVKELPIDGMPATVTSVNEDRYPYSRTLHLYTNKARETPVTKDFVRFVQSKRGQRIVGEMGFVRRFEPRFDLHSGD